MRWGLVLVLLAGCVTPPKPVPVKPEPVPELSTPAGAPQASLRSAVEAFLEAAEAGRFDQVHARLSKQLRERYSVKQLERDFNAEPLASARLAQIKLKLAEVPAFREWEESANFRGVDGRHERLHHRLARLEWAPNRSLQLTFEEGAWRISALE
ncbi:MAG: hypothetical protein Q8L48_16970 [Archangium sp.]|nr:hypothetical protein [Archangium sp.]